MFPVFGDLLTRSAWLVAIDDEQFYPGETYFSPEGDITGFRLAYFVRWRIVQGVLIFEDNRLTMSVRFERIWEANSGIKANGDAVGEREYKRIRLIEYRRLDAHRILGRLASLKPPGYMRDQIRDMIHQYGWEIGEHSYGAPIIFEPSMAKLGVGRFVSMAGNTCIALGGHRTDSTSTYPFAALKHIWPSAPNDSDHVTKGDVRIGNDVWIGAFAFIGSGVTIGDGAVIASHATVVKNVPPYAIVAGNPGRVVRYRFNEDTIQKLLAIAWWNWDDERIAALLPMIMSTEIGKFIEFCESPIGKARTA